MLQLTKIEDVKAVVKQWNFKNETIGFVPTMGYLHEGHASLIEKAKSENGRVVVSIFVNPTQFSPTEDLSTYPRSVAQDCALCESLGVDMIFMQQADEM